MNNRIEKASEMFLGGYNCAQTVLSVFCGNYGLEPDTAKRISCGLGSGARSAELCGAVSGAVLVIGLKYGETKELCNAKTEEFIERFKAENESVVCHELLKCDICTSDGKEYAINQKLFTTRCLDLVIGAVRILEELHY